MMLVSLISYIDRSTLALLSPTILKEANLTGEQYGYVISAFSVAYMIGNPVWGILLDRFGVRIGMTLAVTFWTLASAAHAFASGLMGFAVARALLGFGEGATFPGGLRTAVQSLPPSKQSRGIAVAYSGGSLGAIVTPLIITPIALRFGWRGAFLFTGLIGLCWVAAWLAIGRRIPVVAVSQASNSTLRAGDSRLWAFMACYALGGLPLAFVLYQTALYLAQDRGLSQQTIGSLLWIPPLGWEVGYFFWGWISDRFRQPGKVSFATLFAITAILSVPLAAAPAAGPVWLVMFALFFAMFVAAGYVILSIAYATEVFSAKHAGFIAGAGAGSWSALVALVMPSFGRLFDSRDYGPAFLLAALAPVLGTATWYVLNRSWASQPVSSRL